MTMHNLVHDGAAMLRLVNKAAENLCNVTLTGDFGRRLGELVEAP